MADVKIALIGAGSAAFSLRLMGDLVSVDGLEGSTVCFMDVDRERLDAVYTMAQKYIGKVGKKVKLDKTVSREDALRDSDFVVNVALAGGHYEQETMRRVGEEHGYYRGLDAVEFNMVQDYMTIQGYGQLKLALEIARDTHDLAPNAWFLEVANPMFEVVTLIGRESGLKRYAGYCHGYKEFNTLVSTLGLNREDVDYHVAGFNHNIFLTRFTCDGEDASPVIDEWLEKKSEKFWKDYFSHFDFQMSRAGADMYRLYGLYPIGDTVRSGSWKYHYDLRTKQHWYGPNGGFDSEIGYGYYLKELERRTAFLFSLATKSPEEVVKEFPQRETREDILLFVDSIANGTKHSVVLDIPNDGTLSSIPKDIAIEVSCVVDSKGIHPEKVGTIPRRIVDYVLTPRMARLEWVIDAFMAGSRDMLLETIVRDRRTASEKQAREVLEAILALPFNKDMNAHYA